VSQIRLERPCIVSLIGECATASVPQHMSVRLDTELRLDSSPLPPCGQAQRSRSGALRSEVKMNGDLGCRAAASVDRN
jgi:hypothetical protein